MLLSLRIGSGIYCCLQNHLKFNSAIYHYSHCLSRVKQGQDWRAEGIYRIFLKNSFAVKGSRTTEQLEENVGSREILKMR